MPLWPEVTDELTSIDTGNMRNTSYKCWTYFRRQHLCYYKLQPPHAVCDLRVLLDAEANGDLLLTILTPGFLMIVAL